MNLNSYIDTLSTYKKDMYRYGDPSLDEINQITAIALNFVREKKLIIYGGLALDQVLRFSGHEGIYSSDQIKDIDCYTEEDNTVVGRELVDLLVSKGFKYTRMIPTVVKDGCKIQYKFFSTYYNVMDLTPHPELFDNKSNYVEVEGIRYIHPHFYFFNNMNIFATNVFFEYRRWEKNIPRFELITKHFPFPKREIKLGNKVSSLLNLFKSFGDRIVIDGKFALSLLLGMGDVDPKYYDNTIPIILLEDVLSSEITEKLSKPLLKLGVEIKIIKEEFLYREISVVRIDGVYIVSFPYLLFTLFFDGEYTLMSELAQFVDVRKHNKENLLRLLELEYVPIRRKPINVTEQKFFYNPKKEEEKEIVSKSADYSKYL